MHKILMAMSKLDFIYSPSRLNKINTAVVCLGLQRLANANCSSLSDWEDNKIMCSISTPKSCGALTRNSLSELMSHAKVLSRTESSNNYIPTQNTLVQAFKKSRIMLSSLLHHLPSCRHWRLAAMWQPGAPQYSPYLCAHTTVCCCECASVCNVQMHVCKLLLFKHCFAVR